MRCVDEPALPRAPALGEFTSLVSFFFFFFQLTSESNHLICGRSSFRTTVISLLLSVWLRGRGAAEATATFEMTNVASTD